MFEYTWRWYGLHDRITLSEIRQAGATGIVSALHHIPVGDVWSVEEIEKRKKVIEEAGLLWSVVESVPVHEAIKKQQGDYLQLIANYKQTLRNLSSCGVKTVCYNFMPVLDWSRTHLDYAFPDGSLALRFEPKSFAAFDIFILKRPNAAADYTKKVVQGAEAWFAQSSEADRKELIDTVLLGLPGSEESYQLAAFQTVLDGYKGIDRAKLKENLQFFLKEVIPVAIEAEVKMAIHPDDPPRSLLGLPRVVSTAADLEDIINTVDSPYNGITFCTGSLGAGYENDVPAMAQKVAHRVNFGHLRNVTRSEDGAFYEDYFLEGDVDMYAVVKALLGVRVNGELKNVVLPIRPDHGNQMLGDLGKQNYPGYSLYGRMKGLAEIKGLALGIERSLKE